MIVVLALALAVIGTPLASPVPAPSPGPPLKEIGSVRSTPYCTAFYKHFNGAVHPLLENDFTLDRISISLDNVNTLFSKIDWDQQFYDERYRLERYVSSMQQNNVVIQSEINQLREAQTFSGDPERSSEIHMLAQEMQRALDKQKQMSTDVFGIVQGMIDYENIVPRTLTGQPIGGVTLHDLQLPADEKNIKSYLRFDGMRDILRDAEVRSAAHAQTVLEKYC
ncbi:MAG: hypothetical protein JO177_04310 [Candidatus Eremiobacteraeota bacterium]|nr:hypothetical protein [Candidatus Eremiobacteraeota bacterium]